MPVARLAEPLYTLSDGVNRSAIKIRALAAARGLPGRQVRFTATLNGRKQGSEAQLWARLVSHTLSHARTVAIAERVQHAVKAVSAAERGGSLPFRCGLAWPPE